MPKISVPPISHGSRMVADSSFGTVCFVSVLLLVVSLYKGAHVNIFVALLVGIMGAASGYILWRKGYYRTATFFNASGLLVIGLFTYMVTATIAGAAGILFLASVITAGGLLGWRAAVLDVLVSIVMVYCGTIWGEDVRIFLEVPQEGVKIDEFFYMVFVISSLPSWGIYVVAIDASNRQAWEKSYLSNLKLSELNSQLQRQQELLSRSKEQQEMVAKSMKQAVVS